MTFFDSFLVILDKQIKNICLPILSVKILQMANLYPKICIYQKKVVPLHSKFVPKM